MRSARGSVFLWRLLCSHERLVRWVYAPLVGIVAAIVVRFATRGGPRGAAVLRWLGRRALQPSSCCPEGGADAALTRRFLRNLGAMRETRLLRALLEPAQLAVTRRWMAVVTRVVLLQELRHHLLAWVRERTGVPAVLLADAQISVAPDCELGCTGCYALPGHGGVEPTTGSILRAVDEAAALGATTIHLIGKGEPLAPRDRGLAVARAMAARPHLLFTVATSSVGVPDEVVAALRAAGNVFVFVSVDGPPEAHAERRGEGSFDAVRATMARLRARGVPFGYSTMVSRQAIPAIADPDLVASLAAEGCLLGVYVRYFPLSPGRAPALLLRRADVVSWQAALERLRGVAPIPLVDLDELEEESGCRSRLGRTLYIDAVHGEVTPCLRVPFAPAGTARLGEQPLEAIVRHPSSRVTGRARASAATRAASISRASSATSRTTSLVPLLRHPPSRPTTPAPASAARSRWPRPTRA